MKKIGIVTIGQSPRADIVPSMKEVLGEEVTILERGALDEYTVQQVMKLERKEGEGLLVTRMIDGTEVKVSHSHVVPGVQKSIEELENEGVELTLILCTGRFPTFKSAKLVVYPSDILRGAVSGAIKRGRLAIIMPGSDQLGSTRTRRTAGADRPYGEEVEVIYDAASPYGPEKEVQQMADRIAKKNVDLVFLNCMGFNSRHKQIVKQKTGKPVIQSNALIARVLKELIS